MEFGGGIVGDESFLPEEREKVLHGDEKLVLRFRAAGRAADRGLIKVLALVVLQLPGGDGAQIGLRGL